jgi:hypothetical protein
MAEVVRKIVYRQVNGEYEPVLSIEPKVQREGHKANFAIRIDDLWMYTPDKNPRFEQWMYQVVLEIYKMFNLGVIIDSQRMAEVATVIEEGIDDLLTAPPVPPAGSTSKTFKQAFADQGMSMEKTHG